MKSRRERCCGQPGTIRCNLVHSQSKFSDRRCAYDCLLQQNPFVKTSEPPSFEHESFWCPNNGSRPWPAQAVCVCFPHQSHLCSFDNNAETIEVWPSGNADRPVPTSFRKLCVIPPRLTRRCCRAYSRSAVVCVNVGVLHGRYKYEKWHHPGIGAGVPHGLIACLATCQVRETRTLKSESR